MGKTLWEGQVWQCAQCHGAMGEGVFGKPLAGDSSISAQDYINQVRSPRNRMPSFSTDQVTDEQLTDMQAYMTSLSEPTENGFRQIDPPAGASAGQQLLIEKRCVACHEDVATTGQGRIVNGLIERGVEPTADHVTNQLRNPFMNMPAYTADQVSDADAALIADFLAEQVAAQTPPAALPTSGSSNAANWPVLLLLIGGGALIIGFAVRRFKISLS